MALARERLTASLGHNAGAGRAGISEVENTRVIRILISEIGDRAIAELYSLERQ